MGAETFSPKKSKSEAEVAEQITRIAQKLNKRAANIAEAAGESRGAASGKQLNRKAEDPKVLMGTGRYAGYRKMPEDRMLAAGTYEDTGAEFSAVHQAIDASGTVEETHPLHKANKSSRLLIKPEGSVELRGSESNEHYFGEQVSEVKVVGDKVEGSKYDILPNRREPLSLDESVSAAAKSLGNIRGEVVAHEIANEDQDLPKAA